MRKIREDIDWKEERFRPPSDEVDKNRTAGADMDAELQGLQVGEGRRGSNASQAVVCCLEMMLEQIFVLGADQARAKFEVMCQMFLLKNRDPVCADGRRRRRKKKTVNMNKSKAGPRQQLVLPAPGGFNEGTPESCMELDLPRVRSGQGESGGAGKFRRRK